MKKNQLKKEFEEIVSSMTDKDIDDAIEIIKNTDGVRKVEMVDEKIDDGCDDNEHNDYVIMRSYNIDYKGRSFYVRFYYGDCDGLIGCYDVRNN